MADTRVAAAPKTRGKRNAGKASDVSFEDILSAQITPAEMRPKGALYGVQTMFRPRLSAQAAFFAVLAGAVAVDGREAPEEAEELIALTHRTKTLAKLKPEALEKIRTEIAPRLTRDKIGVLIDHAAKSLPKKMRESAFGHACDIIFADRAVLQSERNYLKHLQQILGLSDTQAEEMLRAIRAKNLH